MEQYGDFTNVINRLECSLNEVRAVWADQTALTYEHINENMQHFAAQIWNYYNNSVTGHNAVKTNYNEAEFDNEINQLNSRIDAV